MEASDGTVTEGSGSNMLQAQCMFPAPLSAIAWRSEEDERVSQWLVYLLSKAADVDKDAVHAFHTALEAASTGTDRIVHVTRGAEPEDPLDELCNNTADPLTSVAFLPEMPRTGVPTRVAARNFDFRGLILPGSFNPVHNGHITLARTAQQLVHARTGLDLPVAFELAVSNADKGAIDRSTIVARIAACETAFNGDAWPVFVTQAPLFRDKARVFPGCTFVVGADTVRRLVDPTYYQGNEHEMVLQLDAIARQGYNRNEGAY
ncbi:hypothetical protein PsorP6_001709 [Peronosclerospora sorghi]|uniref:Uncharacterized protein n=1 Tax=Peronosclerospora sorghi TaxID=230839 RepID=A0ACC0WX84_9STRA|nr:hypothetical protein PsorP6_001709 [Peronosclerospora sorghi]